MVENVQQNLRLSWGAVILMELQSAHGIAAFLLLTAHLLHEAI